MIKFIMGFLCGIVAMSAIVVGPDAIVNKSKAAGGVAMESMNNAAFEICQREFLDETKCYQSLPAKECDRLIQRRCK